MTDTRDHHSGTHNYWGTQSEKDFLDGLGQWTVGRNFPSRTGRSRLKYLVGYRDSIPKRMNWDQIDRNEVISHLNLIMMEYGIPPLVTPEDQAKVDQLALEATCNLGSI